MAKTTKTKPAAKKAAPKKTANQPTQLDRIEKRLDKVESSLAVLRSGASFMQELKDTRERDEWPTRTTLLTMALALNDEDYEWLRKQMAKIPEKEAPQGLQPGDYTDASKEVADALTAMGWKWVNERRHDAIYIWRSLDNDGKMYKAGLPVLKNHLDPAEFLSRAAVTAKELGLTAKAEPPVVDEPWVPNVGDLVASTRNYFLGISRVTKLLYVNDPSSPPCAELENGRCDYWDRLIPATPAEVHAHEAAIAEQARKDKEASKPLEFGTPVQHGSRGNGIWMGMDGILHELAFLKHGEDKQHQWSTILSPRASFTVID